MKCCVFNCRSTWKPKSKMSFFRIPTCHKRRRRWIKILKHYVNYKLCRKRENVCEKHFLPDYIQEVNSKKYLTKDAEPTIFEIGQRIVQKVVSDEEEEEEVGSDDGLNLSYTEYLTANPVQIFKPEEEAPLFMVFKSSPHSSMEDLSNNIPDPDEISVLPEIPIIEPKIEPISVPIKTRQSNINVIPEASFTDIDVPDEEPDSKRKPLTGSYFRAMKDLATNLRQMQRELIEDFFKKQEELMREEHEFQKRQDEILLSNFQEQTKLLLDGARNLLSSGLSEPPDIVYINED